MNNNHTHNAFLALIEERFRLKATACRWLIGRQGRAAEEIHAGNQALCDQAAKIPAGCNLWMMGPDCAQVDHAANQSLACCFDLLAEAVRHLHQFDNSCSHGDYRQALKFAAEAQKLVHQQMPKYHRATDPDQSYLFHWLRKVGPEKHIYLPFLRTGDRVELERCTELRQEIAAAAVKVDARKAERQCQQELLTKLNFQLSQSAEIPETQFRDSVFQTIADLTDRFHLPPSNIELRTVLVAYQDSLPYCGSDAPQSVQLVYRDLESHLDEQSDEEAQQTERQWSDDVLKVADIVQGRSVVVIGGLRKRNAEATIAKAFRLKTVNWVESHEHDWITRFAAAINKDDVCLVLHLTRFSRHFYNLPELGKQLNKPYVRVTRGYNPNSIAQNILQQVGNDLR